MAKRFSLLRIGLTLTVVVATGSLFGEPVRLVRLSPASQSALPNSLVPEVFSARVERANGEPVPGAQVQFYVNICVEPGVPIPGVGCPGSTEYGGFDTGAPTRPLQITVTSDAQGIATAGPYRVGVPTHAYPAPEFEVFPYVGAQTTSGGLVISVQDATHPIGGYEVAGTTISIVAASHLAVPTLGTTAVFVLAALLAFAAVMKLSI